MSLDVLTGIPAELVTEIILPHLSVKDILRLSLTCRALYDLTGEDKLWKERCKSDFAFTRSNLGSLVLGQPSTGGALSWKKVYGLLANGIVYGWGSPDNGRLARENIDENTPMGEKSVSSPVELPSIPGTSVTGVVAGGWSMHMLDVLGRIYVLGALDGHRSADSSGFESPHKQAHQIHRVSLRPEIRFITISCSIDRALAIDEFGSVWGFPSWGCPLRLQLPRLDGTSENTKVEQAECGRHCCALLMRSGTVRLWWWDDLDTTEQDNQNAIDCTEPSEDKSVHRILSVPFDCAVTLVDLPTPEIGYGTLRSVASTGDVLIGLTDLGHVLLFRGIRCRSTLSQSWLHLVKYSQPDEIRQCLERRGINVTKKDSDLKMSNLVSNSTHHKFAVYRPATSLDDTAIVFFGLTRVGISEPKLIKLLQALPIISISMGDAHDLALTADGRVFAWGSNLQGCLGTGNGIPNSTVPCEVLRFGTGPGRVFCISITANGWHSGALAIDLQGDRSCNKDKESKPELTKKRGWKRLLPR